MPIVAPRADVPADVLTLQRAQGPIGQCAVSVGQGPIGQCAAAAGARLRGPIGPGYRATGVQATTFPGGTAAPIAPSGAA